MQDVAKKTFLKYAISFLFFARNVMLGQSISTCKKKKKIVLEHSERLNCSLRLKELQIWSCLGVIHLFIHKWHLLLRLYQRISEACLLQDVAFLYIVI